MRTVFIASFLLFGQGELGEYRFKSQEDACRFVIKVRGHYHTLDFGYVVEEFRDGKRIGVIGRPAMPGPSCDDVLRPILDAKLRKDLKRELDELYGVKKASMTVTNVILKTCTASETECAKAGAKP